VLQCVAEWCSVIHSVDDIGVQPCTDLRSLTTKLGKAAPYLIWYGVATISRLLKIIGLLYRIYSL